MKSNKLLILFLILTLAMGCGGGGGGSSSSNPPGKTLVSVSVTPANPTLARGTSQQFTAMGTYSDNSTQDLTSSASWSSSNPLVASIGNATGTATAATSGTTTITAASGNIAGTTALTVTPATLQSLAISPTNPTIALGTTQQFTATGTYSDNSTQNLTTQVTWSSTAPSVASISNTGMATAAAAGTTTIMAASGNISGTTTLTVSPATLQSLAITPPNPSLARGTTQQFTATGTYSDSSTQILTTTVTWSSSNPSVASISNAAGSNGRATAAAVGTVTITAASGSVSGTTTLTVTPATLQSITVSPPNPSIALGATQQFTATGTYSDSSTQTLTTTVTWSSSAPSVATVSNAAGSNGLATSVAAGATTITAVSGTISGTTTLTVTGSVAVNNNVLPLSVNGSLCAANSYTNKPCVSVTVCAPGTSSCQTITDILLDTGSYGLRIFQQLLPLAIQQAIGTAGLAECVQFGDGSSLWGAVQTASVVLGSEPPVTVPIQAVNSTFGTSSPPCGIGISSRPPSSTPAVAGFNGILGVGLFTQDCGSICVNSASNGMYFSCNGATCSGTSVASLASQVQNPTALLPVDNNGVILQLPSVPLGGAPAVEGSLILGIDTQPNNTSSGATAYAATNQARFTTTFSGVAYSSSFIDSGSNGLFFSAPSASQLPDCLDSRGHTTGWFCPLVPRGSAVGLSATNTSVSGTAIPVNFQIGNANSLFATANKVFIETGGSLQGGFDWGLPFFLGRKVYVGFSQKSSLLGIGPYWAY